MRTTEKQVAQALELAISKRVRVAATNSGGRFSSTWMFWSNKSDYYFGSKSLLPSLKVSLHANGVGYLAYDKRFYAEQRAAGIGIPARAFHEWRLPPVPQSGAVHIASLFLPGERFHSQPPRNKTIVFEIEDGAAAEFMLFLSRELRDPLEAALGAIGLPLFFTQLENQQCVSIVTRANPFDPSVLPSDEQIRTGVQVQFQQVGSVESHNVALFTGPLDGGVLQIMDIGGVSWAAKALGV
jgi:hypothetical protein